MRIYHAELIIALAVVNYVVENRMKWIRLHISLRHRAGRKVRKVHTSFTVEKMRTYDFCRKKMKLEKTMLD